jgi:hypothetical protein
MHTVLFFNCLDSSIGRDSNVFSTLSPPHSIPISSRRSDSVPILRSTASKQLKFAVYHGSGKEKSLGQDYKSVSFALFSNALCSCVCCRVFKIRSESVQTHLLHADLELGLT